jgi:hypothetical protein
LWCFAEVFEKLWLRNVVFWHGKHGVDRGESVAGNTTNFATKNTPLFQLYFLSGLRAVLPDGLPAREAVTS